MFEFLAAHVADIIVIAVLAVILFFVIRGMVRKHKAGGGCGCGCSGCSKACSCGSSDKK